MKLSMNNDIFKKILSQIRLTLKRVYQAALSHIEKLNKRQRLIAFITVGVLLLLLLIVALRPQTATSINTKRKVSIPFETPSVKTLRQKIGHKADEGAIANCAKLQSHMAELQSLVYRHDANLQQERQAMLARLASLASQHDMQQFIHKVVERNSQVVREINQLQDAVKALAKQSKKTQWVNAQSVERYFKLVAVQGFSDGMRAIIDVDGNQTALSVNEICAACRGWVLHSMNFADQSAVFTKHIDDKTLYMALRVK